MGSSGPTAQITSLTWAGHDFAATARDDARWRKVMGIVQDKSGAATLEIVKDLLLQVARTGLGL
jgi:hypothetical protein